MPCCDLGRVVLTFVGGVILCCCDAALAAEPVRLTTDGKRKLAPVFMPGGQEIAYSVHEVPNKVVIRSLNPKTGSNELLFPKDDAHQFDAAFSPDGRYWCYCRSAGVRQLVLVIQDKQDNDREVTYLPSGGSRSTVRSLQFTPDGKRLLMTHSGEKGLQIASLNLKGQDLKYLTTSVGTNYWPTVSPDGKRIAFSSSRDGAYDIYSMNRDGSDLKRLTESPSRDIRPTYSPDGKQIAFVSARDGNLEIYVMNADGTDVRRVTNHADRDDFPVWHPDGEKLLLVADRDGRSDLYLIDVPIKERSE